MSATPKRRRYQFSFKTLLVGMTLLCIVPGGYVANEQRKAREQTAEVQRLTNLGAEIHYDGKLPERTAFLRSLLGDEHFGNLAIVSFGADAHVSDDDLAFIGRFPKLNSLLLHNQFSDAGLLHVACARALTRLDLSHSGVTDRGLGHLSELTRLERLFLSNTGITDSGVRNISRLPNLEYLYLNGTQVSDAGLAEIAGLKKLQQLVLDDTRITDAGLNKLKGLRTLKILSLMNTNVTEDAITRLKRDLPDVAVFH